MHVRMKRDFTYDVPDRPGITRTLPAGWAGEVDDDVGEAAVEDGAAENAVTALEPEKKQKAPTSKEIIEALSADEKAAFDKLDGPAKGKFLADKKAAAVGAAE